MNIQVSVTHPAPPLLQQMTLHVFVNLFSFLTGWCEAESAPEYLWLLQGWFHESQCQQPLPESSSEAWRQGSFISEFLPVEPPVTLPSACLRCQTQTHGAVGFAAQHEPVMRVCVLRFIPELSLLSGWTFNLMDPLLNSVHESRTYIEHQFPSSPLMRLLSHCVLLHWHSACGSRFPEQWQFYF